MKWDPSSNPSPENHDSLRMPTVSGGYMDIMPTHRPTGRHTGQRAVEPHDPKLKDLQSLSGW